MDFFILHVDDFFFAVAGLPWLLSHRPGATPTRNPLFLDSKGAPGQTRQRRHIGTQATPIHEGKQNKNERNNKIKNKTFTRQGAEPGTHPTIQKVAGQHNTAPGTAVPLGCPGTLSTNAVSNTKKEAKKKKKATIRIGVLPGGNPGLM